MKCVLIVDIIMQYVRGKYFVQHEVTVQSQRVVLGDLQGCICTAK